MEVTYSIGVSNRFLLDVDSVSDPQDIFAEKEQRMKEKKDKTAKGKQPKPTKKAEPVKKTPEPEPKTRKDDSRQERSERPDTGRRGGGRGGRGGNQDRSSNYRRNNPNNRRSGDGQDLENQENQAPSDSYRSREGGDRPPRSEYQGDRPPRGDYRDGDRPYRGRGRGRGGPRSAGRGGFGGRGGSSEYRGGKREFDRHSGSDKSTFKGQEKREGGGSHNWGNAKDDFKDLNTSNTSEEPTNPDWNQPADGEQTENAPVPTTPKEGEENNETTPEDGEEKEPEKDEMTLDEYKALQSKDRMKSDFNKRRAGEGEDNSQWKQTYVLKKEAAKEETDKHAEYYHKDHHTRPDSSAGINITFADQPGSGRGGRGRRGGRGAGGRGGGERGGRGRPGGERMGRGGGGRGGGRGGRYRDDSSIAVDNEEEFPSLSK